MHGNPNPDNAAATDQAEEKEQTLIESIRRSSIGLGIFAVVTAGIIAVTQLGTKDVISDNIRQAQSQSLFELIPASEVDNDLLNDTYVIQPDDILGNKDPITVNIARKDNQIQAIFFPVTTPHGYSGNINMLVGVKRNGEMAGVRVLSHKETPGLGDKVETKKSDWIHSLSGLSLENPGTEKLRVKKDGGIIDQFTGATITPRAIVNQSRYVLQYFNKHKDVLLAIPVPEQQNQ
ncbi:electron transport complex subunit RsxG [Oceanospirillum sediminis]|uniref:Ion-translocating oxidoreductase complex subunit G n=1 Tax=Oceanospirillum sediminis TaxID=2760088 RepID=A0A839ITJ1_9GAMM|nr:electron transport complex subunit RsxG [Oceanospirillum sediminis]MBB1487747.1 electron transport complex subunit RsxG [Oceanospirillum sediminis]